MLIVETLIYKFILAFIKYIFVATFAFVNQEFAFDKLILSFDLLNLSLIKMK